MSTYFVGNWQITETGITWTGSYGCENYFISIKNIFDEKDGMLDWLIHICNKTWMKYEDKTTLIISIYYIIELYKLTIPQNISIIKTIDEIFNY